MNHSSDAREAIKAGLLSGDMSDLDSIRLAGMRCATCGEASLGTKEFCSNCGSSDVSSIELGSQGTLWSYTVVRHRPPGNYKGAEPFPPFGVGLVELPEGIRVFSPVAGAVDELEIGAPMVFQPYVRSDEDGRNVVSFNFGAAKGVAL